MIYLIKFTCYMDIASYLRSLVHESSDFHEWSVKMNQRVAFIGAKSRNLFNYEIVSCPGGFTAMSDIRRKHKSVTIKASLLYYYYSIFFFIKVATMKEFLCNKTLYFLETHRLVTSVFVSVLKY